MIDSGFFGVLSQTISHVLYSDSTQKTHHHLRKDVHTLSIVAIWEFLQIFIKIFLSSTQQLQQAQSLYTPLIYLWMLRIKDGIASHFPI